VSVSIGPAEIVAGEIGEAEVVVENVTDVVVTVTLDAAIEYADGTTDRLINLPNRFAITIEPGQGFIVNLLFFVPEGTAAGEAAFTAAGEAAFTAAAKVADVADRGPGSVQKRAAESALFTVVRP
jgi:hypothetical protein